MKQRILDPLTFIVYNTHNAINSYGIPSRVISKNPIIAYSFTINPNKMNTAVRKVKQPTLTKNGFVTQYWFNNIQQFQFSGVTEPFVGPSTKSLFSGESNNWTPNGRVSLKQSVGYREFWKFQQIVQATNQDLTMVYDGTEYTGGFSQFSYEEDGDDPFAIKYTIGFDAYPYGADGQPFSLYQRTGPFDVFANQVGIGPMYGTLPKSGGVDFLSQMQALNNRTTDLRVKDIYVAETVIDADV